ncbi:MAG: hypothetical protein RI964_2412 [Pseudomonadota bacterium]|jgi:hypothetical protein
MKQIGSALITLTVTGLFIFVSDVYGDELKPYLQTQTLLQVGPAMLDTKLVASRPNEVMYGATATEMGVKKGDVSIGALYRKEYQMIPNADAADYFYATEKSHQLTPNRTYHLQLERNVFEAKGLHVTKQFQPKDNLNVTIGGSVLQGFGLQKGTLSGTAVTSKKGKTHSYNVKLDYQYSDDDLLDRPDVQSPDGMGYAMDVNLNWQPTQQITVNANAQDLLGAIHWSDVPYTTGQLTSDVKSVDADGFVTYNPHLSGREGYKSSMRQTLKPKLAIQSDYRLDQRGRAVTLATQHLPEADLWGIGGKLPVKNGVLQATVWPENKMLNVGFTNKRVDVSVGTDGLKLADMHALWVSVGLH